MAPADRRQHNSEDLAAVVPRVEALENDVRDIKENIRALGDEFRRSLKEVTTALAALSRSEGRAGYVSVGSLVAWVSVIFVLVGMVSGGSYAILRMNLNPMEYKIDRLAARLETHERLQIHPGAAVDMTALFTRIGADERRYDGMISMIWNKVGLPQPVAQDVDWLRPRSVGAQGQ